MLGLLLAGCSFRSHATSDAAGIDTVGIDTPVTGECLASGACRRKPITARMVTGGPHADFVMLVALSQDAELAGKTAAELQFTDAAGMPLSYERVAFSPASGALTAWVRVPSLAMGTTIYLWWGGSDGVDHQDRAGTWPAAYAGVWHLDETSGTALEDSTANGNTATATNVPDVGVAGVVGSGVALDGNNDYLKVTQSPSLAATTGNATFALWTYWSSRIPSVLIFTSMSSGSRDRRGVGTNSSPAGGTSSSSGAASDMDQFLAGD